MVGSSATRPPKDIKVFDDIRHAFRELLHGNVPPEGRRELIAVMKDTLVQAKLALEDLREGVEVTRKRVERERAELDTIRVTLQPVQQEGTVAFAPPAMTVDQNGRFAVSGVIPGR